MHELATRMRESLRALEGVFRNGDLRRMQLASMGSVLGNWGYLVALFVYAFDQGGAAAVGLVSVIRMIPAALAAPLTGSLADRFDRRRVMISADVVRAVLMAVAAVTIWLDGPAAVVYCIVGLSTITSTAFLPAEAALLPSLVRSPGELTAANVAQSTVITTAEFLGPAVGGLLLVVTTIPIVFMVNGASFLWSAALVLGIHGHGSPAPERHVETESVDQEPSGRFAEAMAGVHTIFARHEFRLLTGLYAAQMFVVGALEVLVVVVAFDLLGTGEGGVGYLNAAIGAGGLVGGFVALGLATRNRLASDFGVGVALCGLPLVLIGASRSVLVTLAALAIIGVGVSLVDVSAITILQRTVPDAVLGRALGAVDAILHGALGIGAVVAPLLIHLVGLRSTLIAIGMLLPALVLVTAASLRSLDRRARAPAHVAELRAVDILGALPEATLERLAFSLQEMRLPAGSIVIREGEAGELFYVIGEGEVEVAGRTLGVGDSFGEIALLRDVPRTATVEATTDVVLHTLERDVFVAAITGHEPAHATAESVVAARLEGFTSDRMRFID